MTNNIDHIFYINLDKRVDRKELFFKGEYQVKTPYDIKQEDFSDAFCSSKYVQEILKTKEVTCLK
jgi:hypothetical protein